MKKALLSLISISTVALMGSGCVSLEEYDRVVKHLESEQEANVAVAAENERLTGHVRTLSTENQSLKQKISGMQEAAAAVPQMDQGALSDEIRKVWGKGLKSDEWEFVQSGSAVGVRMDDSGVLFKSGSWDLTEGTKDKLKKLAAILKEQMDADATKICRVDGHTDDDPVKKVKTQGIKDNVHLSAMRAMAVREFLATCGLPGDRIFVAGFGEHWPVVKGADSKSKQRNRRVEVYLGSADGLSIGALPGPQIQK